MAGITRRVAVLALLATTVLIGFVAADNLTGSAAAASTPYNALLRTTIASLTVMGETPQGFDRYKFSYWVDADNDGCNTRAEVLLTEAVVKPSRHAGCSLSGGRWYSYYDNKYVNGSTTLKVDHLVDIAEAWESGANTWTSARRQAFANDLDSRTLVAVTATVDATKGAKDPVGWLPSYNANRCRYLRHWVAIKKRWWLTVNSLEKAKLVALSEECPDDPIAITITPQPASWSTSTSTTAAATTTTTTVPDLTPRWTMPPGLHPGETGLAQSIDPCPAGSTALTFRIGWTQVGQGNPNWSYGTFDPITMFGGPGDLHADGTWSYVIDETHRGIIFAFNSNWMWHLQPQCRGGPNETVLATYATHTFVELPAPSSSRDTALERS